MRTWVKPDSSESNHGRGDNTTFNENDLSRAPQDLPIAYLLRNETVVGLLQAQPTETINNFPCWEWMGLAFDWVLWKPS